MAETPIAAFLARKGSREAFRHFQMNLLRLEQGRYEILDNDQFVTELVHYLADLYHSGYIDFSYRVLNILGEGTLAREQRNREKTLFALSYFAESVADTDDEQLLKALSWIYSRWLAQECEYLGCFEHICNHLQRMLEILVKKGKYSQAIPWLNIINMRVKEQTSISGAMRSVLTRMNSALVGILLEHATCEEAGQAEENREELDCLFRYLNQGGATHLVRELYGSNDRKRRLELISVLCSLSDNITSDVLASLGEDSPWYMVRNGVHILAHAGNPQCYKNVEPFLTYPDSRVQSEVVRCILNFGGDHVPVRLIRALEVCADTVKPTVIRELARIDSPAVEAGLIHQLVHRSGLSREVRHEILVELCKALRNYPTVNAVQAIRELIAEQKSTQNPDETLLAVAKDTLRIHYAI